MKIGIFNPYLEGLTGGEKYILTLASCLSSSNEVIVFWDDETILKRAEVKFGLDLSNVKTASNIFSPSFPTAKRLLESSKYDAIVFLSDGSIPFLFTKVYIHFQFPVQRVNGKTLKNKIKIAKATKIFCNSQFTKKYIDKTFNIDSEVIYPPIDNVRVPIKKENSILTVGRFGRTEEGANFKKHNVLIEAFKKMIDHGLKKWTFTLVISVRDEDSERLKDLMLLAKGYPIEFVINPDNPQLWEQYNKAKIYWHASGYKEDLDMHPEYAEHFGMTTVEAMGVGGVPIVINAGGQKEIVEHGKNGYLWSSIEELITVSNKVIQSSALFEKLSKESVERSKIFNKENFCNSIKKMLQ